MGPASFEEVRALDRETLQQLLAGGGPEQRVWALWELAQRAGAEAGAFARGELAQPDVGVRRTLAVVLAGHGELDLLLGLARHDPAPAVRASAMQLVARLAAGDSAPAGLRAVLDEEQGPASVIAILGAIGAGAPGFLVDRAVRELGSAAREVQLEALEALLRTRAPAALEDARRWLLALPDPSVAFDAWIRGAGAAALAEVAPEVRLDPRLAARAAGEASLAHALAGAPARVRATLLVRLEAPPWRVVAPLVEGSDALLREALQRPHIAIPAHVLAGAVLRGQHPGFVERLTAQLQRAVSGTALLAEVRAALDLDDPLPVLGALTQSILRFARAREVAGADGVIAELSQLHPVEHLVGLENALARWIDEGSLLELGRVMDALRIYCERQLEELRAAPHQPRGRRYTLLPDGAPAWDGRQRFATLLAAIRAWVAAAAPRAPQS